MKKNPELHVVDEGEYGEGICYSVVAPEGYKITDAWIGFITGHAFIRIEREKR